MPKECPHILKLRRFLDEEGLNLIGYYFKDEEGKLTDPIDYDKKVAISCSKCCTSWLDIDLSQPTLDPRKSTIDSVKRIEGFKSKSGSKNPYDKFEEYQKWNDWGVGYRCSVYFGPKP